MLKNTQLFSHIMIQNFRIYFLTIKQKIPFFFLLLLILYAQKNKNISDV